MSVRPSPPNPAAAAASQTGSTGADTPSQPVSAEHEPSRRVWPIVARREISVKMRDRNFLISTTLLLVMLVAALAVQIIIANHTAQEHIAVTSPAGEQLLRSAQADAHSVGKKVAFYPVMVPSVDAALHKVNDESVTAALLPTGSGGWHLVGKSDKNDTLQTWIGQAARDDALQRNATTLGATWTTLTRDATLGYDITDTQDAIAKYTAEISAGVFATLFYVAALIAGTAIANSVVEEKQNRIAEIFAAVMPIRQLLIGKVIGNTVLAMAQVVLLAGVGAVGLLATGKAHLLSELSRGSGWFVAFFLLGFLTLATLWAVVGALATRLEDIQSTSPPMTVLVMGIFFLGLFARGDTVRIVSFVPLLSTIAMPTRVLTGDASGWQALIALLLAAIGSCYIMRLAERMYRNSLMQNNRRTTIREALRGSVQEPRI